jgi:hypothetical protein
MLGFQFVKFDCSHGAIDSLIIKLKRIKLDSMMPTLLIVFNKNVNIANFNFRDLIRKVFCILFEEFFGLSLNE